jgi:penicillin-binding protein 1A
VAVRIGFDDNRSLGSGETGGRVALPVFRELMFRAYGEKRVGPVPRFPAEMEQHISEFLESDKPDTTPIMQVIAAPARQ